MRYTTRRPRQVPRADLVNWEDEVTLVPDVTVYEDDPPDTFTGLYTADGDELHRLIEKEPLGFTIPTPPPQKTTKRRRRSPRKG